MPAGQSGEEFATDAVLQDEVTGEQEIEQEEEFETEEQDDQGGEGADPEVEDEEDDLPELSEREKTAFEKRMERERKKERERIEAEYEQRYGRHKQVIDMLGGDPEAIERRIREQQVVAEAQRLAEQNGWNAEETRWYVDQQRQQHELKELRVQMAIYRLRDNPDYAGIASMERDIMSKIDKSGGALTVEEAYWALGGHKRAEQIRLEAQVREQAKRQKQPRTVLTDSPTSTAGPKPLPADVLREAERMGISATEARRLMNKPAAQNIDEWRAQRQKKKG